ncbi:BTB/POZ and MATH domain-containing protein 3-like [Rhodamnia argentea]|uniref:BTB/POZ and MATH domain-containing protein 3-like n=1 Tax=Rhodamnia argentea TaxID=178133 RepID=A0A8B8N398_9MYRT|nr:BTB/POZ and MATH domain-containing protein 3-like [Rhodamnia argentea]
MAAKHEESLSRMSFDIASGSSTLLIPNFSQAPSPGVDKFLSSKVFAAGGYNWAIRFFPGGRNPEDSDYLSAYIALLSEGWEAHARALFVLWVEDQSGYDNHLVFTNFESYLVSLDYPLMRGYMWGNPMFSKRDHSKVLRFIKDDCLILHCTVGVVKTRLEEPIRYRVVVPPPDIGRGMKALLDSGLGMDVNLIVGHEIFKAHKVILAARSPRFRDEFFDPTGDGNKKNLTLKDVDPPIFQAILEFIYTDEFPDISISKIAGSTSHFSSTNALLRLMVAADLYRLNRLRLLCESRLTEHITTDTVAAIIALADQHQFHKLKAICLKFATNPANMGAVMESERFKSLEEKCMEELLAVSIQNTHGKHGPGQNLSDIVGSGNITLPTNDGELRRWKIKAGKALYALAVSIENELMQHIKRAQTLKEVWDNLVALFARLNDVKLQRLKNES